MKKAFFVISGLVVVLIIVLIIRWLTIPDLAQQEIILQGLNRRYYSLDVELADLEEIQKIVIYDGFFSFDGKVNDKEKLKLIEDRINEKVQEKDVLDSSIDLGDCKAYLYGESGSLVGLAIQRNDSWIIRTKDGLIRGDAEINQILNKNK